MSADIGLPCAPHVPPDRPDANFPSVFGHARALLKPSRGGHASPSLARKLVSRHGARLTSFSLIGGGLFIAGIAFQAALTSGLRVPSVLSYVAQAVLSIEASFLLNRWFTWRKRATAFWPSFRRYNLQKTVTVAVNLVLYAGLLRLGMNYLLANVLLTAVFTVVNYISGDRFVFTPRGALAKPLAVASPDGYQAVPRPMASAGRLSMASAVGYQDIPELTVPAWPLPTVSVVVPCRDNHKTIRTAVESLLRQDYPELREIILIGSPADTTWDGLEGIHDRRLMVQEVAAPPGIRDANFKRDVGIRESSSDLVALVDSDMVLPHDWLSRAVTALDDSGADCVAGVMKSISDDFWGRFVDRCRLGAKTPRVAEPYFVTAENFGAGGRKPPITANILFTRKVYDRCPINSLWSHGSLEDYEWFWRIAEGGNRVLVTHELFGWHHHRTGLTRLAAEYRRSARGCAYFIRAHPTSPFARKRLAQAVSLPLVPAAVLAGLATGDMTGYALPAVAVTAAAAVLFTVFLCGREFARTRTLESLGYPLPAILLGASYTASLVTHLVRRAPMTTVAIPDSEVSPASASLTPRTPRFALSRLLHPLTAILAAQAGLSLSLVWSNTAFSDEADYLALGRELIGYWLHGTPWRPQYAHTAISGSPFLYPPLGGMANGLGGLIGARILSLIFMLGSTVLLYSAASRLFDGRTGLFAAALWVVHSPTIQLGAFATFDAMSVSLTAFAGWLIVQTRYRDHCGEFVAVSGAVLALANATAFSGIAMDPLVIAFAFLVWLPAMGGKRAISCTAWLAGACAAAFSLIMTLTKCWGDIVTTVFSRAILTGDYSSPLHVFQDSWTYTGLITILAVVGAVAAINTDTRSRGLLVASLAFAALVIPVAQAHEGTAVSLKKHLAYGAWFAVIAAAYGCHKMTERVSLGRMAALICCAVAFMYPAVNGWWSAWAWYHSWYNADSLIAAEKIALPKVSGDLYIPPQGSNIAAYISRYYLAPTGTSWERFVDDAPSLTDLSYNNVGAVILVFPTSVSPSGGLPDDILLSPNDRTTRQQLLTFLGTTVNNGQLSSLTAALEKDHNYRLAATGPYDSETGAAVYAIWVRK